MGKNFLRVLLALCSTLMLLAATGCATQGQHNVATAGDHAQLGKPIMRFDRLVTKSAEAEGSIVETDVSQIIITNSDGTPRDLESNGQGGFRPRVIVDISHRVTDPTGKVLLINVTPGALVAGIQGAATIETAKQGKCNGNCGTMILNDGQATAGSTSGATSGSTADVKVGGSLPCKATKTCGKLGD